MTTSSDRKPAARSEEAIEAWREWFALPGDERQQPTEPYTGRHRPPADHADGVNSPDPASLNPDAW
jgi:hypothetical protein